MGTPQYTLNSSKLWQSQGTEGVKVIYKKGVDIPIADALSRVTPMDPEENI